MKMIYRSMAPIALALLLLTAGCSQREAGLTSAEATALASGQTGLPTTMSTLATDVVGTGTALTLTPGTPANQTQAAPVTAGGPPVQLCQFCMEGVAHAIVSIAETSTFSVPAAADGTPAATCNSVETLNGRQVVLCYATTPATFRLNVCASDGSCSDFLVSLQSCPNAQPATRKPNATALPLTPTVEPTQPAPTDTPGLPTDTPIPPTSTP